MLAFDSRRGRPRWWTIRSIPEIGVTPPYIRRKRRGLLWFWAIGLAAVALVFWTTQKIPALQELMRPVYWIIAAALVLFTIKWFRPRSGDRRRSERRHRRERKDSSYHAE
jgi:hypothetical protein